MAQQQHREDHCSRTALPGHDEPMESGDACITMNLCMKCHSYVCLLQAEWDSRMGTPCFVVGHPISELIYFLNNVVITVLLIYMVRL